MNTFRSNILTRLLLTLILIVTSRIPLCASPPEKTIVCFGDSITAGYGLDDASKQSYPAALERLLKAKGMAYHVINQGVSGNTTKDAVVRASSILALHPDLVLVEFGGNDGLRGLPLDATRKNLDSVLSTLQTAHIPVLLIGITLPPNYGADYTRSFNAIFRDLAAKHHIPIKPMLYDGIYTVSGTIQDDGIHPTAKGSQMIAEHLLPLVMPLLRK